MTNREDGSTALADYAAASALGTCRTVNEDTFGVIAKANAFLVVDGCGGATAGTGAARTTVECVEQVLARNESSFGKLNHADGLAVGLLRANAEVLRQGREDSRLRGQGATVGALRVFEGWVSIAHVGDCRVGRLRDGQLAWLTEEHSLLAEIRRSGAPIEQVEQVARDHAGVVTRAVGTSDSVAVDIAYHPTRPLDLFLLCSDGLWRQVLLGAIAEIVADGSLTLRERCAKLLRASEAAGGQDNATAILVRLRA